MIVMSTEEKQASHFEREHRRLEALLRAHLLAVVGLDFAGAQHKFERWHRGLLRHIEIENTRLLPHVPAGARWDARIYRLEHERIALLAQEHAARVAALAQRAPRGERPAPRRAGPAGRRARAAPPAGAPPPARGNGPGHRTACIGAASGLGALTIKRLRALSDPRAGKRTQPTHKVEVKPGQVPK
jgi:hypothetical protein